MGSNPAGRTILPLCVWNMFIKIILIVVLWIFIRRFLRGMKKKTPGNNTHFQSGKSSQSARPGKKNDGSGSDDPFQKITQQDIDDADFEEIP